MDFSISCECTKSFLAPSKQREQKKEKKPKRHKTCDLVEEVQKSRQRYFSERRSKAMGYLVPVRPDRGAPGISAGHVGVYVIPTTKSFITVYESLPWMIQLNIPVLTKYFIAKESFIYKNTLRGLIRCLYRRWPAWIVPFNLLSYFLCLVFSAPYQQKWPPYKI